MTRRLLIALVAPFLLVGCVLTPGKFVSTLRIDADRSFAFTYKGEVIALDPGSAVKGMGKSAEPEDSAKEDKDTKAQAETDAAQDDAKFREMATALGKEAGYRSVVYEGKGKFLIDYAVAGTLTHGFVFPYNTDAQAVFPFLAIEVRKDGLVRVKAPGFAGKQEGAGGMGAMGGGAAADASRYLDGRFTLDTDAEIVSQNNEDGAVTAGGRKSVAWRATPLTKDAPTAVLRLRP